ncbi:protein lev-9-like [Haemaphysalis longicornis]
MAASRTMLLGKGVIILDVVFLMRICSGTYCPDPGPIANGHLMMIKDDHTYQGMCCPPGTMIIYSCLGRYAIDGKNVIRCTGDGRWTHSPPKCSEYPCKKFHPGDNLHVDEFEMTNYTTFPVDTVVHFRCESGYRMRGLARLLCLQTGWFGSPPHCEGLPCSIFQTKPHLYVTEFQGGNARAFPHGTIITYGCDSGFALYGPSRSRCAGGVWLHRGQGCETQMCPNTLTPVPSG